MVSANITGQIAEHAIERAIQAESLNEWNLQKMRKVEELLREILPMAMWESCVYKDHPQADPTTHCCDWSEIVEKIKEVLGDEPDV